MLQKYVNRKQVVQMLEKYMDRKQVVYELFLVENI
jgi:hypothetical protein